MASRGRRDSVDIVGIQRDRVFERSERSDGIRDRIPPYYDNEARPVRGERNMETVEDILPRGGDSGGVLTQLRSASNA